MAAVVTLTEETFGVIKKIKWAWTAHTDGKVATTTTNAVTTKAYNGELVRLITIPDTGVAPSADYDVYVYDGDSVDERVAAVLAEFPEFIKGQVKDIGAPAHGQTQNEADSILEKARAQLGLKK